MLMLAGLLVCVMAGCISKEPVVFTDEAPVLPTNSIVAPQVPDLSKEDEGKIEIQVFSYLLTRHFWDNGDFTAIFLQADDKEVEVIQSRFAKHVPPIKPNYRINVRPNRIPIDQDTGKPAMILSVDISDPLADGTVPAIGKWYAGGAVTGFYSFLLKKTGGDWEVQNPQ